MSSKIMKPYALPNGLVVRHANTHETKHLYQDIFERRVYFQHGITLPTNAVVIDAGANIGLFVLFVLENCPTASVHAFEPAPKTFELLRVNTSHYSNVKVSNCGLGSDTKKAWFTYLPMSTCGSGYYDETMISKQKERLFCATLADPLKSEPYKSAIGEELLRYQLDQVFKGEVISTPVRPLSSYIDEQQIRNIDLLKVDVEGEECAVLAGIRDEHWKLIRQAAIEVHARVDDNSLSKVLDQLERHGYVAQTVKEEGLLTTMVYAKH